MTLDPLTKNTPPALRHKIRQKTRKLAAAMTQLMDTHARLTDAQIVHTLQIIFPKTSASVIADLRRKLCKVGEIRRIDNMAGRTRRGELVNLYERTPPTSRPGFKFKGTNNRGGEQ